MDSESTPRCASCESENKRTFTGEIAIHFPGLAGLEKPIVWVLPHVSVCLDCGFAEFSIPVKELEVLRTGTPVSKKEGSGAVDGEGEKGRREA
jgi:hypothetical protein